MIALRKLDAKAKLPANIFTYSLGIASSLVLGVGMCLSMKGIGSGSPAMVALGIVLGLLAFAGMGAN